MLQAPKHHLPRQVLENATMTAPWNARERQVLLPGTVVLTGALTVLPFMDGFGDVFRTLTLVYLATFLCSLVALVLLGTSALYSGHRPVAARRLTVAALLLQSAALVLVTLLVLTHVGIDQRIILAVTGSIAILIITWWIVSI